MKQFMFGYDAENPAACAEKFRAAGIGAVVAGDFDKKAAEAFAAAGIELYLCYGAHWIDGKTAETCRLSRDYADREKQWFSSACPNDARLAAARMEHALSTAERIPGLRGIFVDGARFASFASAEGMDAFFTCFCPDCMQKMQDMSLDAEGIRSAVQRLAENAACKDGDLPALKDWLSFREDCVRQYMEAFSAAVHEKNPHWQAGAFVFAPSLNKFVGQTAHACASLDIVSPMIYRSYPHEQGPACLNHEWAALYRLLGTKADAFRREFSALHPEKLESLRENVLQRGFAPQDVGAETAAAREAILPGQCLAPIIQIEDDNLAVTAEECLQNGADAVGYFCYDQASDK